MESRGLDDRSGGLMQKESTQDDFSLVKAAQNGDRAAFSELVRRHQATCLKLAISVLRAREDAEDEVQNALWKAFEHLAQFQFDAKFSTWLSRIVLNQCLMRLRQSRRARMVSIDEPRGETDLSVLELPAADPSPEQMLARREIAAVLECEIRRIPPLLRTAFQLRDIEERAMPVVAASLGISIAAAKSRLLRARAQLKDRLQKHGGQLGAAALLAGS